jgi:hypothetical protein
MRAYTSEEIAEIVAKHGKWLLDEEGGEFADLHGADLSGADLDYSCWPLWCGSKDVIVDVRIAAQKAAHGAVVNVDMEGADEETAAKVKAWQDACRELGVLSHRAKDLGLI